MPRFLPHNFSCRRVSALLSRRYILPHNFSRRRAKDRLRSPGCSETVQQATPKKDIRRNVPVFVSQKALYINRGFGGSN